MKRQGTGRNGMGRDGPIDLLGQYGGGHLSSSSSSSLWSSYLRGQKRRQAKLQKEKHAPGVGKGSLPLPLTLTCLGTLVEFYWDGKLFEVVLSCTVHIAHVCIPGRGR